MPAAAILSLLLSAWVCIVMSLVRLLSSPGDLIFLQFPHLHVVLGLSLSLSTAFSSQIPAQGAQLPSTGALGLRPCGSAPCVSQALGEGDDAVKFKYWVFISVSNWNKCCVCFHLSLLSNLLLGQKIIPQPLESMVSAAYLPGNFETWPCRKSSLSFKSSSGCYCSLHC